LKKKTINAIMLTLLLISMLTLEFNIQPARTEPSIIIVPDQYPTIQAAVNAASPRDIIYVKSGIYPENVYINKENLTLTGEDKDTTIIDGSNSETVVTVNANNIIFERFTLRNARTSNLDYAGIRLTNCMNCSVSDSKAENTDIGISLVDSSNCSIYSNRIDGTNWIGIEVWSCHEVYVFDNEVVNGGFDAIVLNHCTNCNFSNNNVHDANDGVYLKYCANCYVTENKITSFEGGDGIWLAYCSSINVFHNVFIDNGRHAYLINSQSISWDNGCPSGGNYWSDYHGEDRYSCQHQSNQGSDGLGDTPYIIDESNQDNYPLMGPSRETLVQYDKVTLYGKSYQVKVVCNSTILDFHVTPGSEQISASGTPGTTGYVAIVQPVGVNLTNIEVFLNNTEVTAEITTNGTHYFIYFTFTFNSEWLVSIAFAILGDVNFDGCVDIYDAVTLSAAAGSALWDPEWNAKCDLNDDLIIDLYDAVILAGHAGEEWPT
jgi:parallel beta-helix repeat protein